MFCFSSLSLLVLYFHTFLIQLSKDKWLHVFLIQLSQGQMVALSCLVMTCRYTAYSELLPILAAGATPLVKVKQISQEIDSKSMTIVNASTLTTPFASFSFSATASFEVQSPSRIEV